MGILEIVLWNILSETEYGPIQTYTSQKTFAHIVTTCTQLYPALYFFIVAASCFIDMDFTFTHSVIIFLSLSVICVIHWAFISYFVYGFMHSISIVVAALIGCLILLFSYVLWRRNNYKTPRFIIIALFIIIGILLFCGAFYSIVVSQIVPMYHVTYINYIVTIFFISGRYLQLVFLHFSVLSYKSVINMQKTIIAVKLHPMLYSQFSAIHKIPLLWSLQMISQCTLFISFYLQLYSACFSLLLETINILKKFMFLLVAFLFRHFSFIILMYFYKLTNSHVRKNVFLNKFLLNF